MKPNEEALMHLAQAKLIYERAEMHEEAAEVSGLIHLLSDRKQVPA